MSGTGRPGVVRAAGITEIVWGAVLLARGRTVWSAVGGSEPTPADELAIRFLGARHLVQGAVQTAVPTWGQRLFVAIDITHAVTMGALAAVDPARRRPALVTGGAALAAAVTTLTARAR